MRKGITWEDAAKADIRAIDRQEAMRILHAIGRYLLTGEGDIVRLQGIEPPEYRLRVGDYRVRYYDHGSSIHVIALRHRREAYR